MRNKIYIFLTQPYAVIITIVVATLLSFSDRNLGSFYGIFTALYIIWGSKYRWSEFGFAKRINKKTIVKSLIITVLIFIGIDILIQPLLEIYLGAIDLSSLNDIRNDFGNYFVLIIVMWVFAAFGEELLFRGYYMKRFAELFGNTNKAWLISAIIISIYFGASHYYQGPAGMIAVGLVGFCYSLLFYKNRGNLVLAVLVHGFYDMIGLTLIYLNKERIFFDWVQQML